MKKLIVLLFVAGVIFGQNVNISGRDYSGVSQNYRVYDGALPTIDWSHYKLHLGDYFEYFNYATLSTGDTLKFMIRTGADEVHLTYTSDVLQATELKIYEGATFDTTGTVVTDINKDRNNSDTSSVVLTTGESINTFGTLLPLTQKFGVSGNSTQLKQGSTRAENEIILKKNSNILFLFISGGNSNVVNYQFRWYEE